MNRLLLWLWIGLGLGMPLTAFAEKVEITLPNKLTARAEYREGVQGKPAVLLMHGFLQTHEFPTIFRLLETLHAQGFTVLAPNLSLNVPLRKQSLPCEAVHTHTIEGNSGEIDAWAAWLAKKRPGNIVLVGHSTGSMQLLDYLSGHPNPAVKGLVAISIVESRANLSASQRNKLMRELELKVKAKDGQPLKSPLSFCQQFHATPRSLLSYLSWGPERILKRIDATSLPIVFIMGSKDDRLGPGWVSRLKQTRAQVEVIANANHFMDGEHEFDLHDVVVEALRKY